MDNALLGALIGASAALGGAFGVELFREHREGRRRALAARAELSALARLIEFRQLKQGLVDCRNAARDGKVLRLSMHLRYDPVPTTRLLLSNPGGVDSTVLQLAADVVANADGLKADLNRLSDHPVDSEDAMLQSDDPEQAAALYESMRRHLAHFLGRIAELERAVDRAYPPWPLAYA
ncbi:hypothetical protein ABIE51_000656 [Lysobacter sp. OAE881]|uniref:hypothetical protein n=1 Tax=Lysobacter TaxID=68 RepID=UPI001789F13A|nr:hypothetical protein [Lysobacter soli]MDG2517202.1 hypothetical protein [Lysobacter soli]